MLEECLGLGDKERCRCLATKCPQVFNDSIELMERCYMDTCFLPKKALSDETLIKVTIAYCLIFAVGVSGNVLTCIVIRKHPILKTNSSLYLFNLAIADLVTLFVGLPFEVVMNWHQWPWPFPDWVCNLKALIAETTISVSILTILLFSIERYIAVCRPFLFVKIRKHLPQSVVILLLTVWIVSILCSFPFGYYHKADFLLVSWPYTTNKKPVQLSKMCMMQGIFDPELYPTFQFIFHFSAIAFFVIPLAIIFVLYALIARHVLNSKLEIEAFRIDPRNEDDGPRKVTTILCAIVFTFFICYLPFQFQRLAFFYMDQQSLESVNQYLYFISGFLFYLAPIINPILYNVVSARFRRAFKEVLMESLCGTTGQRIKVISNRSSYQFNHSHVSERGGRCGSVEV